MPTFTYMGKRGELRVYSGTSDGVGGNYYFQVAFVGMDYSVAGGRPRPDEIPVLDRGVLTSHAHHVQGPDTAIMAPVQVTWTAMIDNTINRLNLRRALGNPDRESPWSVGGQTFTNVNGTSQLRNGYGSAVSTPLPYDPDHDRVHVEVLWQGDPASGAGTSDDVGYKLNEVWFQPGAQRITEAPEAVRLGVTGFVYGPISTITAFTAGTDVSR